MATHNPDGDGNTYVDSGIANITARLGYEFFHRFDQGSLGYAAASFSRDSTYPAINNLGATVTVGAHAPALNGSLWDGAAWSASTVGYGCRVHPAYDTYPAATFNCPFFSAAGIADGDVNNFAGQYIFVLQEVALYSQPTNSQFFSLTGTGSNTLHLGPTATGFIVQGEIDGAPFSTTVESSNLSLGTTVDFRYRKSGTTGVTVWINNLTATIPEATAAYSSPLKSITCGTGVYADIVWARTSTHEETDQTILGWDAWVQPLPLIDDQPQSIQFDAQSPTPTGKPVIVGILEEGEPLSANIDDISDPLGIGSGQVYEWTADDAVVGGSGSSYTLTSNEVNKYMRVSFSYNDTEGTPKGPLLSLPYGPVGEGVVVPPPTGNATKLNSRSPYWAESYMLVDEGVEAILYADARNVQTAELYYLPMDNPTQGSPPLDWEDKEMARPFQPFTNQVPGVLFEKFLTIPDVDYDGRTMDTDGHRFQVRIPNPQLGYDGWFHMVLQGGTRTVSTNLGRGRYYQVRPTHKWMNWGDVPNLYAWWTPEDYLPTNVNDPNLPNQDRRVGESKRHGHWSKWSQNILLFEWDMAAAVPLHVKSLIALEGAGVIYPHAANPFAANSHLRHAREHYISNRKAFKTIGQVGLRHQYTTPYDASGGITVAVADFHWFADRVGTAFELTGPAGSYLKLGTSGNGQYQLSVNGGAPQETGFAVTPSEAIMVIVTATASQVSVYVRPQFDRSPWPTAFTTSITPATVDTVSFLAEADNNATNASYGLFGSGSVIHQSFDAADTEELEKTMHKWIHYEGCYRAGYPEGY